MRGLSLSGDYSHNLDFFGLYHGLWGSWQDFNFRIADNTSRIIVRHQGCSFNTFSSAEAIR